MCITTHSQSKLPIINIANIVRSLPAASCGHDMLTIPHVDLVAERASYFCLPVFRAGRREPYHDVVGVIRIVVVEDSPLVRSGLVRLVHQPPTFEVVGQGGDGYEAIQAIERDVPQVVLMDLRMPRMDGIQATAEIRRRWPAVRILVMTAFGKLGQIVPALHAGASGYLLKGAPQGEILLAIRSVAQGTTVLGPDVARQLVGSLQAPAGGSRASAAAELLTAREVEVVRHLATGKSNAEIARAMDVSEATVKSHLGNVARKWDVRDRTQTLIRAVETGIVRLG